MRLFGGDASDEELKKRASKGNKAVRAKKGTAKASKKADSKLVSKTESKKEASKQFESKKVLAKKSGLMALKEDQPKGKKPAGNEMVSLFSDVAKLDDKEILDLLSRVNMGLLGPSKGKLKKDVMKSLGVKEEEVFERGTLLAYSRQKNISEKLKVLLEKKKKKEDKAKKKETKKKDKAKEKLIRERAEQEIKEAAIVKKSIDKKIAKGITITDNDLRAPVAPGPEVGAKLTRIQRLLKEQKQLEEGATKRKKVSRIGKAIAMPFILLKRAINKVISTIFHYIFLIFSTLLSIPITLIRFIARLFAGFLAGLYKRVGHFSPFGWKRKINQLIIYSGVSKTQEEITGITIVNAAILSVIILAIGFFILNMDLVTLFVISIFSFALVWVIVFAVLNLMADKRADEVEGTLPDVLQIVSGNISAGMTPYNALWVSARKEFGALAEEIKIAQKETLGGKPFVRALSDMGTRVRSNVLQRTIRLITQGMKAGGELPEILHGIGKDIRQMRLLQKEMAANTMSYILFIMFGMLLGAPLLFSVSIQFVDIMNKFQPEEVDIGSGGAAAATGQGFSAISLSGGACPKDQDGDHIPDKWEKVYELDPKNESDASSIDPDTGKTYLAIYEEVAEPFPTSCITPGYLTFFAILALTSISFFGSLLIALIRDGKQSAGIKLMPLLIPATLGMFMLISGGMSLFFAAIFGG